MGSGISRQSRRFCEENRGDAPVLLAQHGLQGGGVNVAFGGAGSHAARVGVGAPAAALACRPQLRPKRLVLLLQPVGQGLQLAVGVLQGEHLTPRGACGGAGQRGAGLRELASATCV